MKNRSQNKIQINKFFIFNGKKQIKLIKMFKFQKNIFLCNI